MHKTQATWNNTRTQLNEALASYAGTPTELAKASGVNFYAARRFLINGATSRGGNALLLCAYFGIDVRESARNEGEMLNNLCKLIGEVWDGTLPHAALLAELINSTRSYTIKERRNED